MDAPDTSGTQSLARELLVEVLDFLLCQFDECRAFEVRHNVVEDQVPISIFCVVRQLSLNVTIEPVFGIAADGGTGFFNGIFLLSQHNTYHRKSKISR